MKTLQFMSSFLVLALGFNLLGVRAQAQSCEFTAQDSKYVTAGLGNPDAIEKNMKRSLQTQVLNECAAKTNQKCFLESSSSSQDSNKEFTYVMAEASAKAARCPSDESPSRQNPSPQDPNKTHTDGPIGGRGPIQPESSSANDS
jgi:hypothetical protein